VNILFDGNFSERLVHFIAEKNSLGFSYEQGCRILSHFDKFCTENFPDETMLTKELATAWAHRSDDETTTAFRARLTPVREFARYLNRTGERAFTLTQKYAKKPCRPVPYIYTQGEIAAMWSAADNIPPNNQSRYQLRHIVVPAMLRVLYCCGLRPAEARKLRAENVDLAKGKIYVMASKKHTDRVVMMADDLADYCRVYDRRIKRVLPKREFFFPRSNGGAYTHNWFVVTFRKLREEAGIAASASGLPRLYDFRHTFATHRLYQWMLEGRDLMSVLPYLSVYMGHAHMSDTYYYIHLVPRQLEAMSGYDFSKYEALLPEVECNE
jgi:integrase